MNAKTKTSDSHPNSVPGLTADPARQDVWFTLRTDGVTGTGTESDPFDVSMRAEIPLPISSLTFTGREAAVNTRAPHGYNEHDVVVIAGVTGSGASRFNGRFSIYAAGGSTFKYAMVQQPLEPAGIT